MKNNERFSNSAGLECPTVKLFDKMMIEFLAVFIVKFVRDSPTEVSVFL